MASAASPPDVWTVSGFRSCTFFGSSDLPSVFLIGKPFTDLLLIYTQLTAAAQLRDTKSCSARKLRALQNGLFANTFRFLQGSKDPCSPCHLLSCLSSLFSFRFSSFPSRHRDLGRLSSSFTIPLLSPSNSTRPLRLSSFSLSFRRFRPSSFTLDGTTASNRMNPTDSLRLGTQQGQPHSLTFFLLLRLQEQRTCGG